MTGHLTYLYTCKTKQEKKQKAKISLKNPDGGYLYLYIHQVIYQTRKTVFDHISKHRGERDENMTCSGVLLTNFEVFENLVKHCLECLVSVAISKFTIQKGIMTIKWVTTFRHMIRHMLGCVLN